MKEIVLRIKRQKGWTSKELADKLGCSPRSVEGWLTGRRISKPYLKILKNIRID